MHLKPDLVTIDISLPDIAGDELYKKIKAINPTVSVIVIRGQEEVSVAVHLLKMGVNDYLVKDEATKDLLWNSIIRIRENQSLKQEVEHYEKSWDKNILSRKRSLVKANSLKRFLP